jgi:RHS repeat-associated protein
MGRENGAASGMPSNIEDALLTDHFPCIADNAFRNYTQRYQYDAVGNILQMSHHTGGQGNWTRRYQYAFNDLQQPASNRLWRTWQGSGAWDSTTANNKVTYHYDTHGSMLNLADVPTEFRLRWDHRDMIASINLGNGFVHYQYDAGKQRTRKWIDRSEQLTDGNTQNITEERMYLGGLEIYEKRVNGTVKQRIETLHLFDGEQRLLMVDQIDDADKGKSTLYRYTLSNHLGSSTLELDDQAKLISYEEYHPYGTTAYRAGRNAAEVKLKRYRYTGMERDEESGLSYHVARFYVPFLARWASTDPLGVGEGLNHYAYCFGNPIRFTDTNGKAADDLEAVLKTIAQYRDQAKRGTKKIAEHVFPHKLVEYLTRLDPGDKSPGATFLRKFTGKSLITEADYGKATTIIWEKVAADLKTRGAGDTAHLASVRRILDAGGSVDPLQELNKAAENALKALEKSGSKVTRAELTKAMTLQLSGYASTASLRAGMGNLINRKTAEFEAKIAQKAESANVKNAAKASSIEKEAAKADAPPSPLSEYSDVHQATTETAVTGSTNLAGALNNVSTSFVALGSGDATTGPAPAGGRPSGKTQLDPLPERPEPGWFDWLFELFGPSEEEKKEARRPKSMEEVEKRAMENFHEYQRTHPY